jgi:hypothetical protein
MTFWLRKADAFERISSARALKQPAPEAAALATLVAPQKRPPDSFDPKAGGQRYFPGQQTRLGKL